MAAPRVPLMPLLSILGPCFGCIKARRLVGPYRPNKDPGFGKMGKRLLTKGTASAVP